MPKAPKRLSDLDEVRDRAEALSLGGVDYITKPFQVEEVLARIDTHLTLRQLSVQFAEQNIYLQRLSVQLAEQNVRLQQEIGHRRAAEQQQIEQAQTLENALEQCQQTQAQLAQCERISSLGDLTLALASEIEEAANSIYGNLRYATDRTHNLLNLLQLYQLEVPAPPEEVGQLLERMDVALLQSDLPQQMSSMQAKTEYISDIIQSLRQFSRLGAEDVCPVDLHDCLDRSIAALQERRVSDGASVRFFKEYGDLPRVECNTRQMTRVFTEIITNAMTALDRRDREGTSPFPIPMITICTERPNTERVKITITDNGIGMSEDIVRQVFKPFFTTETTANFKGVGMATVYAIVVHQHQGEIGCFSTSGSGTSVALEIPTQYQSN
ncbi:hybrid sensor histidine kinase/response regulator [Oscillatoriales cyanobacterium LEGE 11467]|uniref:histidine kinase n=1 Tax=Zarconia navalis LEGE 11467 TaxID=1828826 RepID=A0A928W0Y2_9CYAN|nr:hybrid sensor histidine kinase/response regulator [Zarconia navalis]MBE9041926.1 hybrid sensor histidine kinase/response regulator [Zarconia navalis LEGE 11467]